MDDLERLLKKYRPSAPPPDLRERMVASIRKADADLRSESSGTLRAWIAPLTLAAASLLFYALSSRVQVRITAQTIDTVEAARASIINDLADALGGDDLARLDAGRMIAAQERPLTAPDTNPWLAGEPVQQ